MDNFPYYIMAPHKPETNCIYNSTNFSFNFFCLNLFSILKSLGVESVTIKMSFARFLIFIFIFIRFVELAKVNLTY